MAKIKLTHRTFSATVAKTMDNADGLEGMFTKALMGKTLKEYLSEQPDNQTLWVDTDKVVYVTDVTEESTTHDLVFGIMFQFQPKISDIVWIDGKEFEAFMKVWNGETEDENRIKRMAEEYDQLAGRLHRLQAFRDTDTYKQLPENSRYLLDKQCKAMDDYESILKQRLQIECDTANEKKEDV